MKRPGGPTDVSAELSQLDHNEKQNKQLPRLPTNTTIIKRPMNHAPIASPYASSKVQKVVYVSRQTPVMSAVKRVKKFLREIEKRAMQSQGVDSILDKTGSRSSRSNEDSLHRKLDDVSEKLTRDAEEVLVKASGRAMAQALRIGEWFQNREKEIMTKVEVRTASVSVIDDIVEKSGEPQNERVESQAMEGDTTGESTMLEGGETTIELLKNLEGDQPQTQGDKVSNGLEDPCPAEDQKSIDAGMKKRKRKRKRKEYAADDVPEARLRWVKAVEVAISLHA